MTWNIIAFSFFFSLSCSHQPLDWYCSVFIHFCFLQKPFFASLSARLRYCKLILCVNLSCLPAQTQVISVRLVIHHLNWIVESYSTADVQKFVCNLTLRATKFLTADCLVSGRDERGVGGLMKCLQQQHHQQRREGMRSVDWWSGSFTHATHNTHLWLLNLKGCHAVVQNLCYRSTRDLLVRSVCSNTTHLFHGLEDFSWLMTELKKKKKKCLQIFFPAFGFFLLQEREWRESFLRENRTRNFNSRFWRHSSR